MTDKRFNLKGTVIDLDLGAEIMGANKSEAKKMISLMLKSAEMDMQKLVGAHKTKNWEKVREHVHKLRGGISYCGTPRLLQACEHLENYLKSNEIELADALYQQVLQEMEQVKLQHKP